MPGPRSNGSGAPVADEAVTVESIANWIYEPLDRPREVTQRVEFKLEDYQSNWK